MTSVHFPARPMLRSAGCLALTLLLGALATRPCAGAEPLPTDLALVPQDAAAFVHLRGADLWKTDALTDLRRLIDRAGPEAYQTFVRRLGPDPSTIDRVTFVMLTPRTIGEPFPRVDPEAMSALLIVRTSKPYDRIQLRKVLGQREKVYRRSLYHFNEDLWSGLALIDNQTFVIGSEDALVLFFDQQAAKKTNGPLQEALAEAAQKHMVTVGLNPQLLGKEPGAQAVPPPLLKLLEARCATMTLDLGKELKFAVRLNYAKDDEAQAGEKAVRGALELARNSIAPGIQQLEAQLKQPAEDGPAEELTKGFALLVGLGMLRELDTQLKDAPVQRQGTAVSIAISSKRADAASLTMVSLAAITALGRSASRTFTTVGSKLGGPGGDPTEEHLKKLAEALEKYHKDKGTYPAPATYDKDGRPLLSWRVALLPYLGQEALYKEFHLDEPWDSLHNKKLLKKLPEALKAPSHYSRNKTTDLVFTGGAAFVPKQGKRKADVAGPAVLLVVANSDNAVYWSKPADLTYADNQPLPKLFGKYGYGSAKVMLANGTFRTLNRQTDEKEIRGLIKGTAAKSDK